MLPQLRRLALVSLLAFLTASCGGGDGDVANSGGIGGTGISSGSISSFGSIFVNGFEFDLTGVPITIDDQPGTEGSLQLGQVVTVTTNIDADGSVTVSKVDFDYNLEGPISNDPQPDPDGLTKTFTVLGTTVIVDVADTVFDTSFVGFDFEKIARGDVVQISGFFDSNDVLHAKYITKTGTFVPGAEIEVEAKGQISNLNTSTQIFDLRGVSVDYSGADLSEIPGGLHNGLFVEVKGTLQQLDGNLSASKIELEGLGQNAAAAAVEGIISSFNGNDDFAINSGNGPVHVDAGNAVFDPPALVLGNNLQVEVQGTLVSGTLIATKIKLRRAPIKLETVASAVEPDDNDPRVGTVTLQFAGAQGAPTKTLIVDKETRVLDTTGGPAQSQLSNLSAGDFLRVQARWGTGGLVATLIRRTNLGDVVLQGPADIPGTGDGQVSVVGVKYQTDAHTEFLDPNDAPINATTFFSDVVTGGKLVKIKDKEPYGALDSAELEN
jgi:hypothetical protein